jgi:MFS family permease
MFKNINKVVQTLVITDFFINSAFGSFGPVFAIFITQQITGGSASVAGYATAAYWLVKSIVQLPIARFLDRADGERKHFWAMFLGFFITGFVPIAYLFATKPIHLYAIESVHGFIMAWAVPAWYAIFTRHVDKWRISFEWSLESVFSVGLATAAASALGGYVYDHYGYYVLFLSAGIIAVLASFILLGLMKHLMPIKGQERVSPEKHGRHK